MLELSPDAPLRVEVLVTAQELPAIFAGHAWQTADGRYRVELDEDAEHVIDVGSHILVVGVTGTRERNLATVDEVVGRSLLCTSQMTRGPERRVFPRLHAIIPARYRIPVGEAEPRSWIAGGPITVGEWDVPDDFMNFSVTGLSFDAPGSLEPGQNLLFELGIGQRPERWRCTAEVVRCQALPPEELQLEPEFSHRVAVAFVHCPGDAQLALAELTESIQGALLF